MKELTGDSFYQMIKEYDACGLEYVLLQEEGPYAGETSHRKAVSFALDCLSKRYSMSWTKDMEKAGAVRMAPEKLLALPGKPWKRNCYGTVLYDDVYEDGKIPYWYAFLEPPHGTGKVIVNGKVIRNKYGTEDFKRVNHVLFPNGTASLTAYEWTTDWSDFFDDGHEWWGAACWSVYDSKLDRFAVILASETD